MIEKIIEEMVDGVEAVREMHYKGKYALDDIHLYKIKDGIFHYACKLSDEPYLFTTEFAPANFFSHKYQILDSLPNWAQEPKNPFKVEDIVVYTMNGELLEVDVICGHDMFLGIEVNGDITSCGIRDYNLATPEEKAKYYEAAYKSLKNRVAADKS